MSLTFAAQLNKMIEAGLGGAVEAPETGVAVGRRVEYTTIGYAPILTFEANSELPLKALSINMEPIQDLHGQANPYPAGGGKNKWSLGDLTETVLDYNFSLPAGTYTFSCVPSDNTASFAVQLFYSDETSVVISVSSSNSFKQTVTLTADAVKINRSVTGGTASQVQLEVGSTATSYAPYSNICPISGRSTVDVTRAGKNLLDSSFCTNRTQNGIRTVRNSDGSITYSGTASGGARYWNSADTLGLTLAAGTYTLSPSSLKLEGTVIHKTGTFTLDAETTFNNVILVVTNGTTYSATTIYPQLEVGATATAYQAYTADTITTPLGQTVYGGTVDVTTGVMTVDMASVDLGPFYWTRYDTTTPGKYRFASAGIQNTVKKPATLSIVANIKSSILPAIAGNGPAEGVTGIAIHTNGNVMVYAEPYAEMTAEQFATAMSGVQLVYELDTPVTIQLSAQQLTTLLGTNNVWSDGRDVSVTYGNIYYTEGY